MSEQEYWGRRLDVELARLAVAERLVGRHPLAYEAQAAMVGYAYRQWRRALVKERERQECRK